MVFLPSAYQTHLDDWSRREQLYLSSYIGLGLFHYTCSTTAASCGRRLSSNFWAGAEKDAMIFGKYPFVRASAVSSALAAGLCV